MIPPDDERHGTTRGYAAGCHDACCRAAAATAERRRRKYRQVLGIHRLLDSTPTARRIHALMAIGWPSIEISKRCGWTSGQAVLQIAGNRWVNRDTAETIARVYDELHMKPGPSAETRARAERKGWAAPLAWEDIDRDDAPVHAPNLPDQFTEVDEAVVLRVIAGERRPRRLTRAECAEIVNRLLARGLSTTQIAEMYGFKTERYVRVGRAA